MPFETQPMRIHSLSYAAWQELLRGGIDLANTGARLCNALGFGQMKFGELVTKYRDLRGWKKTALARVVGCSQPVITQIESGEIELSQFSVPIINALQIPRSEIPAEVKVAFFLNEESHKEDFMFETRQKVDTYLSHSGNYDFPVYYGLRSTLGEYGTVTLGPKPAERIEWPTPLATVDDSYAVRVTDTTMEPLYKPGDVLLIHPSMHMIAGSDVLLSKISRKESAESKVDRRVMIKQLMGENVTHWHLKQWSPGVGEKQDFSVLKSDWPLTEHVFGKYNRR